MKNQYAKSKTHAKLKINFENPDFIDSIRFKLINLTNTTNYLPGLPRPKRRTNLRSPTTGNRRLTKR